MTETKIICNGCKKYILHPAVTGHLHWVSYDAGAGQDMEIHLCAICRRDLIHGLDPERSLWAEVRSLDETR